jgi:Stress responsive A/B Barrel Domain
MIAHVVLFRPKANLTGDERQAFVDALEHALTEIDLIKRSTIGRRVRLGRLYDQQNAVDFPFAAILEFATEADLLSYLEHPAHLNLGRQFYVASEQSLAFDYEALERDWASQLLLASTKTPQRFRDSEENSL